MSKRRNVVIVILGAILLSTVAIQASDIVQGERGNLLSTVWQSDTPCGPGATMIALTSGALCVDQFEAAPGAACPQPNTSDVKLTQQNMNTAACLPVSQADSQPWRFVSLAQAQQLCARVGKRLPTDAEWYRLALAQASEAGCVVAAPAPEKTDSERCATASGVHDMVGNVWEWVDAQVHDGQLHGQAVPAAGYVSSVSNTGTVLTTTSTAQSAYGADYAITEQRGTYSMVRGGFFGSGSDAGIFAQNLAVASNLQTAGIGFRCVASVE